MEGFGKADKDSSRETGLDQEITVEISLGRFV